jgi:shikimate dehydrogenase
VKICDQLSENAKKLQAVNLVTFKNNMVYGYNTDGDGFVESLKETFPEIVISKLKIAIFGAGGAAKSIALSLSEHKPKKVSVFNRNINRAAELVKKLKISAEALHVSELKNAERSFDLLINATPLGMAGVNKLDTFDFKNIRGLNFFADIVYNPEKTKNMFLAEEQNIKTMGGLGMLLYQAVPAFEAFYGKKPKVSFGLRSHIAEQILRVEK